MSQANAAAPAAPVEKSHGKLSAGLVVGALGVVFGDIGTSPLYTLQECLAGKHGVAPDPDAIFGVTSLVCWAITLVVTIKYLAFLMRADNEGEGGIMALLALVPARLRTPRPGRVGAVALLVIAGAALLYGDGIITPAISVLSAVEGLGIATRALEPLVVPITLVILVLLFAVQRRGTGGLGRLFGPIMMVWFLMIAALGVWHIGRRPEIIAALSPYQGAIFFVHHGWRGFRVLGGVVLAVTGGEALYADMGHFGRRPIRLAWMGLIYPALLLCYLGQGATLLSNPAGAESPFYAMIPPGPWIYGVVAVAALATVIASQALISGVFSLTHQAMRLGYFPRLKVVNTSGESEGQIYLPLINWGLAAACLALVVGFQASSKLAAAYGLAVAGTMTITSVVYAIVVRYQFGWSRAKTFGILALFLAFDIPFAVANALKFFDGGYLPFAVGLVFVAIMVLWRRGRTLVLDHYRRVAEPVAAFLADVEQRLVGRIPGTVVFLTPHADDIPPTLHEVVRRFRVLYDHTVIATVRTEHHPTVPEAQRIETAELGPGLRRVVLRFGFMDRPSVPPLLWEALDRLDWHTPPADIVYILGRESFAATAKGEMGAVSESLFDFLNRNARKATDEFAIPPEQVVEVGTRIDL